MTGRSAKSRECTARDLQTSGNELAVAPATTCLLTIIKVVRSGLVLVKLGLRADNRNDMSMTNVAVTFEPTSVVILHMFLMIQAALCYPDSTQPSDLGRAHTKPKDSRFIAAVHEGIARRGKKMMPMVIAE